PAGAGAGARARQDLPPGFRAHAGRLLSAALRLLVQLRAGSKGYVSEISGLLPLAREHGRPSDRQEASRGPPAARADRARAGMGRVAPPEILDTTQPGAEARSVLPAHIRRGI